MVMTMGITQLYVILRERLFGAKTNERADRRMFGDEHSSSSKKQQMSKPRVCFDKGARENQQVEHKSVARKITAIEG